MRTPVLCTAALFIGLAAPRAHAQPQALATDRLDASMIANNDPNRPMALVEERLRVTVDGQHATSTLTQVFKNNTGTQVEGRYRLQPGSGSKVEGFAYWNGEQKIVGEVFERQMANEVYNNVTQRRRDPGLLEEDGEGAFAFKVFPINANEKKRVELTWGKWLERHAHSVRYRAPVNLGGAEIVVAIDGAVKNVRSSSHKLHVEKTATGVRLRSDGALRAGELVIDWDVDDADWTPAAYVQPGGKDDAEGWFAVSLAAPDLPASAIAAKDVTIVIDRSGSMTGEPIAHARAAAADMIKRLHDGDRVNVITFSDEVDPLFAAPQTVDADTRRRATAYVQRIVEGGGTDIALALNTAIKSQAPAGSGPNRPRVVVFMTDGQSDADRALAAAKADTGDIRLFTLGLGKEVNKPLLQRLSAQKRGKFSYIADAQSIEGEVGKLAQRIASPLLVDISVEVEGAQGLRMYPRTLPDLFAADELVVTGRLRSTGGPAKFVIKGKLANGKQMAFWRTVDVGKTGDRPWVGRMWAQSRVEHLLEEIALGEQKPEFKNEVIDLALMYNFVTPFTAFLAIPESELGAMAGTVAAARERKKKLLAGHPQEQVVQVQGTAPTIDPTSTGQGVTIDQDYTRNIPAGRSFDEVLGASPGAQHEKAEVITLKDRRHGCAGCATGGPDGALLVGALALLVLRRRRRA
jgi:Ca-activated chloride channel homolog